MPSYDRAALAPGVVHLSVGSFHRSHQAVYFDGLAELGHTEWGIVGVGLRRAQMKKVLELQDGLYTVVTLGNEGASARVIGAMTDYLYAPEQSDRVLAALADARTALVTLTITSDGYEAEPSERGSALGYLVEALARRHRAGVAPFTVLSCDNHAGNGQVAQEAVSAYAALRDPRLADWIDERVAFPSSMVDRITPQTTLAHHELVQREFGLADRWPVVTEPFSQWVIEDDFCNRRPPLDQVGVRLVPDVRPYSLMKTRLLNATHCAIGHLGSLCGLRRTDEVMRDPVFRDYVVRMMADEIAPVLPPVPGVDLDDYQDVLLERLANRQIGDSLSRLCRAGSAKVPAHVLSSLAEARAEGHPHALLTLAVAGWCRYLWGYDERGAAIVMEDPQARKLQRLARAGGTDPRPLLFESGLFGVLEDDPNFAADLQEALVAIERHGVRAALASAVADDTLVRG